MAKRVTTIGIFTALAMIFSYVEVLIPFTFAVPGMKLGLANLVVVTGIYCLDWKDVCTVSLIRILLTGLLFGNGVSILYSFSGGIVSLIVMMAFKKTDWFSVIGVSVSGAVFHNIGQILAAVFVMQTKAILSYLPVLMITGVVTGFVLGLVACRILTAISFQLKKNFAD